MSASLADRLRADWFDYKDEILTQNFTLPFKRPAKAKELKIEIHDPAYYIDFELVKQAPVHLTGAGVV